MKEHTATRPYRLRGLYYVARGFALIGASLYLFLLWRSDMTSLRADLISPPIIAWGIYSIIFGLSPMFHGTPAIMLTKAGLITIGPWSIRKRFYAWADIERFEINENGRWPFIHRHLVSEYAPELLEPADGETVKIPVSTPVEFSLMLTHQNESEAAAIKLMNACEHWRRHYATPQARLTTPTDIKLKRDRYLRFFFAIVAAFLIFLAIADSIR